METIDSSFPLRKRKYFIMLEYTRTHADYDSVFDGDCIACYCEAQSYWSVSLGQDWQMQ